MRERESSVPPLLTLESWGRQGSDLGECLAPFDPAVLGDVALSEDCKDFLLPACLEMLQDELLLQYLVTSFSPSQETWRHEKSHFVGYNKCFILGGCVVVWYSFVYFPSSATEIAYGIALVLSQEVNLASRGLLWMKQVMSHSINMSMEGGQEQQALVTSTVWLYTWCP